MSYSVLLVFIIESARKRDGVHKVDNDDENDGSDNKHFDLLLQELVSVPMNEYQQVIDPTNKE